MGKPDVVNLLRNRLVTLRIFYEYHKFIVFALYYALRKNETGVIDFLRILYPPEYIQGSDFRTFIERFSSINETQLISIAPMLTQSAIDNQRFDMWFIYNLFFPCL
jgi:hypothetical protein